MPERVVTLAHEADVDRFRREARAGVAAGVAPPDVRWRVASREDGELFDGSGGEPFTPFDAAVASGPGRKVGEPAPHGVAPLTVPAFFVPLCEHAALHADPGRFDLLYRLLWRLVHEPALRHDPLDADRRQAESMANTVRREMHKMTAFVRFRPVTGDDGAGVQHVAWFEPAHHVVEATAPFFARRFAQMRWAILTPERCVRWDGHVLEFGPGADRSAAPPADAAESLWLTYYASIFNPARLKLAMMRKEMPRRYWKNLPEAALIQPLAAAAAERTGRMVAQEPSEPLRRRPSASRALAVAAKPAIVHPPGSLAALRDATAGCRACPLGAHATQAVHGEGDEHAPVMLVGEQPGDQEDLHGRPFVGPAGQLLDRALRHLGWARERLYLTNAVRHFKFELRGRRRIHKTPAQQEAAACLHWLEDEMALVRPRVAVALGGTAARSLLGRAVSVTAERGQVFVRPDGVRVVVTLHPAALLRMPPGDQPAAFTRWVDDLRLASNEVEVAA